MTTSSSAISRRTRSALPLALGRTLRMVEAGIASAMQGVVGFVTSRQDRTIWVASVNGAPGPFRVQVPLDAPATVLLDGASALHAAVPDAAGFSPRHLTIAPFQVEKGSCALALLTPAPPPDSLRHRLTDAAALLAEAWPAASGAISEVSSRYRSVVEAMSEGVVIHDHTGAIVDLNDSAARILERAPTDIEGRDSEDPSWEAIRPDGSPFPGQDHPAMHTLRTGAPQSGVVMGLKSVDGCAWLSINTQPLLNSASGDIDGVVATFTDITETRRQQEALRKSEAQHRNFLKNVPVGVYRTTPDGQILFVNDALVDMMGFRCQAELKTIDLEGNQFPEDDRDVFKNLIEKNGVVSQREVQWFCKDGSTLTVLESARAVRDDAGGIQYYEGIVEDVTERRQAALELRAEKEFIDSALNSLPGIFFLVDENIQMHRWNREVERVTGFSTEDIRERSPLEFFVPGDRPRVVRALEQAFQKGVASVEARVVNRDTGVTTPFSITGGRVQIQGATYVVGTGVDISRRVETEAQLKQAKEEAEEANALKSAFLANMSHEIRTPLTSIIGFAEVLSAELDGENREFLDLIRRSGYRLRDTLTSVLDLARLESETIELDVRSVDLVEQVEDTLDLMRPLVTNGNLALRTQLPRGPVYCDTDPNALHRIVTNLVSNAIKFTDDGRITVSLHVTSTGVVLSVSDTGQGIDAAFQERIFDEFRQESGGVRRRHEGSGLGLTITRHLVHLMDGDITVESEKGVGSTFTVTFPHAPGSDDNA